MGRWVPWVLLLTVGGIAVAEDMTISTYYPSPRGVYDELVVNTLRLRDAAKNRDYDVTVKDGKLLLTDKKYNKSFLIVELPPDAEMIGR
jgi:hypothetical protein